MIVRNNIEYYTIKETADMLGKYSSFFYTELKKGGYPKPDIIDGVKYYSINDIRRFQGILGVEELNEKKYYNSSEVGELIGKSRQTIVNWTKHSDTLESRGEDRLIPRPDKIGKGRRRYWKRKTIKDIQFFSDNIIHGDMAEFNRNLWGNKR